MLYCFQIAKSFFYCTFVFENRTSYKHGVDLMQASEIITKLNNIFITLLLFDSNYNTNNYYKMRDHRVSFSNIRSSINNPKKNA